MHEEPSIFMVRYHPLNRRKAEVMYVKANTETDARAEVVYYFARKFPKRKLDVGRDLTVALLVRADEIINPLPPMSRAMYDTIRVK
jgi:hypothetical protein